MHLAADYALTIPNLHELAAQVAAPPQLDVSLTVLAPGVLEPTYFLPFGRPFLEQHRREIEAMLRELPLEFLASAEGGGGGWSFLNACMRVDGSIWASTHADVELLVAIGQAAGLVRFGLPREYWGSLPGGLPYFEVTFQPGEQ